MISEEIGLNQALEAAGITPVETDLGEYLIQLRNEPPSHIIAPAVHLTRDQIEADFRKAHTHLDPNRDLTEIPTLVEEARLVLRQKYLDADVGITGANFLIAETGTSIIVTNEGNGDLTQTPAQGAYRHRLDREDRSDARRCHDHPARAGALGDGPGFFQLYDILDRPAPSRRSRRAAANITSSSSTMAARTCSAPSSRTCCAASAAAPASIIARSIRRWAAMPMAGSIRGRSASVVTPALIGIEKAKHLPNASTFCGRCEEVCPMRIPLAQADAPLAREGIREAPDAGRGALGPRRLGLLRQAAQALSVRHADRGAAAQCWAAARAGSRACLWPRAGRNIATCRRPRARPSRRCGRSAISG